MRRPKMRKIIAFTLVFLAAAALPLLAQNYCSIFMLAGTYAGSSQGWHPDPNGPADVLRPFSAIGTLRIERDGTALLSQTIMIGTLPPLRLMNVPSVVTLSTGDCTGTIVSTFEIQVPGAPPFKAQVTTEFVATESGKELIALRTTPGASVLSRFTRTSQ
jgi:hypothetical protein